MRVVRWSILIILLFSGNRWAHAQCNDWDNLLTYENAFIENLARDRFGNLYVIGEFNTKTLTIGSTTLSLLGVQSVFVLKFDNKLTLQWAKAMGGGQAYGQRIEIDKEDNVVVAGHYYGPSISFDNLQ